MFRLAPIMILLLIQTVQSIAQQPRLLEHYTVAASPDKFNGWPANNGVWQWDNEILVGFTQGEFNNSEGHNLKGIQHSMFARSVDNGQTWTVFDPDNFLDDENIKWLPKGKTALTIPMDFKHEGFAMRVFATGYHGNDDPKGGFYYSYDRGATWKGPHHFGSLNDHPELKGKILTPRTDYIVNDSNSCTLIITAEEDREGATSRIACVKTNDGGLTFEFVTWITPKTDEYRAIMPQTVQLANGDYMLAYRKIMTNKVPLESTIDIYVSKNRGKSWRYRSKVKEILTNSNPPSIAELPDGRICCIYGDRDSQLLAGKYSQDRGKTWGSEFVIRSQYKSVDQWADMGYPRMVLRPDGKLAAFYYWASPEHPQQFIAGSIWQP